MSNVFYFDSTRCMGCKACQVSCKDKNRLSVMGVTFRTLESYEVGTFPDARIYHLSTSCNHCEAPACVENCPTGALQKLADGTVTNDHSVCIGCGTCAQVCPYGVPTVFEEEGIMRKCDACQVLRDLGGNPACVDACPGRALDFGPIEDIKAKYGDALVSAVAALPDGGTSPNVLIKAKDALLQDGFRSVIL